MRVMNDEDRRRALRSCTAEQLSELPERLLRDALLMQNSWLPAESWVVTPEEIAEKGEWMTTHSPEKLTSTLMLSVLWGGMNFCASYEIADIELRLTTNPEVLEHVVRENLIQKVAHGIKEFAMDEARTIRL